MWLDCRILIGWFWKWGVVHAVSACTCTQCMTIDSWNLVRSKINFIHICWRHQLSGWWQKLLRGFAWIWVVCYNFLGPKLHTDMCHVTYTDLYRCVFGLFLIFWPFLDLQSDFSERRFLVALCHLHPNILWVDPTIWYRSRDISLTTPDTLIMLYTVPLHEHHIHFQK